MKNLFNNIQLKERMAKLKAKWKDKVPEKFSDEYWRYRADMSYFKKLKSMLKNSEKLL